MGINVRTIKVKVVDFEKGANPENLFLIELLRERYQVVFSEKPDYLFYSVWGREHLKYDCVRIFYTGEPISPDFSVCDYAMGFDYIEFEDRYLRLPLYAMGITEKIQDRSWLQKEAISKRKFCNFIYSNETVGRGAGLRKLFCQELMKYRLVDCPGNVLHNIDMPEFASRWASDCFQSKIKLLHGYNFTIAFENTLMSGYTTEKLMHPFVAGSIPIYYGNPRVAEDFNNRAFIDCNEYENDWKKVIERVKEIDQDFHKMQDMLLEAPLRNLDILRWREKAGDFLFRIVEKGNQPFEKPQSVNGGGSGNSVLNADMYAYGIIESLKNRGKVNIYGDGVYGRWIGQFLTENEICRITNFVVTQQNGRKPPLFGSPVISLEELEVDDTLMIIAVRETVQDELIQTLKGRGFSRFFSMNDFVIHILEQWQAHEKRG